MKVSSVYNVALKTDLDRAHQLSRRLDRKVWFKREDTQPVQSFKLRGAFERVAKDRKSVV